MGGVMSDHNYTQLAYLEEPEKLSKKELLEAFKRIEDVAVMQNQKLREVNSKLVETCILANLLANHLWEPVDAFDAGSEAQINDHLKMLSETRRRKKEQEARVH